MIFSFRCLIALLPILFFGSCGLDEPKKKIIFFGDSITQYGGDANGFIDILRKKAKADNLTADMAISGLSGNKVTDLYLRVDQDVIEQKPTIAVIQIGVNDVWFRKANTGTDFNTFVKFYAAMIDKIEKSGIKPVLCSPTLVGEDLDTSKSKLNAYLEYYSEWIKGYSNMHGYTFIDLNKGFVDYESQNNHDHSNHGILTIDGVHPTGKGHVLIADMVWDKLKPLIK